MARDRLSIAEARRIALAAQGLDRPRPAGRIDARHIGGVIRRLGLLQLDFVNVLVPAHHLVAFSRLGGYSLEAFRRSVYERAEFTEHWAHEASIVPMDTWPLLAYRRERFRQSPHSPLFKVKNHRKYLSQILEIIAEKGAITSQDLEPVAGPARRPGDWHRSVPRAALEHHFGHGRVAVANRMANFQRIYDLPERIIPARWHARSSPVEDAQRELLARAATALGVATSHDLADYFRMRMPEARPRIDELAAAGIIHEVRVDGWRETAWLAHSARLPRTVDTAAPLSPFDPLVWFRPRAERLFDFHYRIEIYVPQHRRKWGYYVL
ncbi:MAG TPA: crosslink repair DNA glycosylase YcaQ family protein, partial [Woeseiaceae bacterium]|nr:crosslink repair DNA glycosylase YcaQ family protein [Woeseiaceae bacterium]